MATKKKNFKSNLENIKNEVDKYTRDRLELINIYVNDKLTKSLENYDKVISISKNYLNERKAIKVARQINKRKT